MLNGQSSMTSAIRYVDSSREQLLVVFNPVYVPKVGERVEMMYHGNPNWEDEGFHLYGYVEEIENFYDCNVDCHDITVTLTRVSNVE